MRAYRTKYLAPAVLAAVIPAAAVLAQQAQPQQSEPAQKREWPERSRLSPDAMQRLQEGRLEGRITEIKEALKLNDAQLNSGIEWSSGASRALRPSLWPCPIVSIGLPSA